MRQVKFTVQAKKDLKKVLEWSVKKFGEIPLERYEELIVRAALDLGEDASRLGVVPYISEKRGLFLYHLRHSKERARLDTGVVMTPRHILVFRLTRNYVRISKILHDSMDISSILK